ncbi:MAG: hypothetical protein VX100_07395 [Pseudomonadota bacterium]|nr:hypothetical protein [Pseudomonadota bacterium]
MNTLIYFLGSALLFYIIWILLCIFITAAYWGMQDVKKAIKHIKKGASKRAVFKALVILFWCEFKSSLKRSISGAKRIN